MEKMSEKKFENSILIEGNYNYNYLTNLLFLSNRCLTEIFIKKGISPKKDKKLYKNIRNLSEFLESSVDIFSRLSLQEKEDKCIIHTVEYKKEQPVSIPIIEDLSQASSATVEDIGKSFENNNITTGLRVVTELTNDVIKKNKEVDDKYNEEE